MTCFNEEIRTLLEELSQKSQTETFQALSEALVLYLGSYRITQREIQYLQRNYSDSIHLLLSIIQSKETLRRFNERIITDTVILLIDYEIRVSISRMFYNEQLDDAVQNILLNRYLKENKLFPEEIKPSAKSYRKRVYKNCALDILRKEKSYRKKKKKQKDQQASSKHVDIWKQGQEVDETVEQSNTEVSSYLYAIGTKRRLIWCINNDMSNILHFWHDIETFIINRKSNTLEWTVFKQKLENEEYPDISTACAYIGMKASTAAREYRRAKNTLRNIQVLELVLQKDKSFWEEEFFTKWESIPEVAKMSLQFVANDTKDLWWTPLASHHKKLSNGEIKTQIQILRKEYVINDSKTSFLFPSQKRHNQYITGKVSKGLNILFPKEDQEEE